MCKLFRSPRTWERALAVVCVQRDCCASLGKHALLCTAPALLFLLGCVPVRGGQEELHMVPIPSCPLVAQRVQP